MSNLNIEVDGIEYIHSAYFHKIGRREKENFHVDCLGENLQKVYTKVLCHISNSRIRGLRDFKKSIQTIYGYIDFLT